MPQRNYQISTIESNSFENTNASFPLSVYYGNAIYWGDYVLYEFEYTGLRFINIDIPQGATITSATLTLIGYGSGGNPPDIDIYCDSNVDSPIGTNSAKLSTRTLTTNKVAWTNPDNFVRDTQYQSPDLSSVVQEMVNKTEWSTGKTLHFIFDTGGGVGANNYNTFYSYYQNPSKSARLEINFATPSGSITQITQPKIKQFVHKIYDKNGNYLSTWSKEVKNVPQFKTKINGGTGQMNIELKREIKDFGENVDVKMGNIIKTWIQDGDQEIGKKIWEGRINRYVPTVNQDGMESVLITATSRMLEMEYRLYYDAAGNTQTAFNTKDPTSILKSIINSTAAGSIFKEGNIDDTGTSVSYTFNADTILDCFNKIIQLSPQYWFYRLNPDNTIDFKMANFDEIHHQLYIGKEVTAVTMTKSNEFLVNRIYFMGGGDPNLYKLYNRTSSQLEFGLREKFIKDERVTDTDTAETISERYFDDYDHPRSEIIIEVIDSNIDPINGYDIERFRVGDIIQILHPRRAYGFTLWDVAIWDVDYWDWDIDKALGNPHQIVEIDYQFNKAILKVEDRIEESSKRIEDINRNLNVTAKTGLPSAPT